MHLNCCPCVVKVSKICKQVYWNKGKGKVCTRASWKWLGISLPPPGWDAHPSQGDLPLLGGERHCERKVSCPRTQHINLTRSWTQTSSVQWPLGHCSSQRILDELTLYTLKSVYIFSIQFFIHFLWCWQGEFVYQSKASFVGDHFLYSHDLDVRFRGDIEGRNLMLVTLRV